MAALLVVLASCTAAGDPPEPHRDALTHVLHVIATGASGPVAGLRVCAVPLSGPESCAATGPDGTVALALVPAVYQVRSDAPAGQRRSGDLAGADLYPGDATVRLGFEPVRRIAGTVRDAGGEAVGGARACANPLSPGDRACEKTRPDGTYALEATPGVYKLSFDGAPGAKLLSQWAFGRVDSGEADVVDVRTADATGIDVTLRPGVALSGTVMALDGHPVKRAQVCTHGFSASLPWDCERTDDLGRYVALREPDRYWLWFVPPDDDPLMMQWFDGALVGVGATPVDLFADETADAVLRPGPAVRGRVVDPEGAAVGGALVCVDTAFPTGRICRPTDATGAYRVTTRPETYLIQVQAPEGSDLLAQYVGGGRTWIDAGTVRVDGGDIVVNVALRRGARVTGVVRSALGVPLEGASVNLSDGQGIVAAVSTNATGAYAAVVPPGRYRLDVFAPFASQLLSDEGRSVDVASGVTIDVTLADAGP
ncbi:MAG TPA: carboxypeptidase-like regulatory domain-containing protein [Candidatus Limnocylindria bacterium]|nr:carboxypeptidase-like regulatory domain-containing protein [Candidatus Limnocylindria bacterium]